MGEATQDPVDLTACVQFSSFGPASPLASDKYRLLSAIRVRSLLSCFREDKHLIELNHDTIPGSLLQSPDWLADQSSSPPSKRQSWDVARILLTSGPRSQKPGFWLPYPAVFWRGAAFVWPARASHQCSTAAAHPGMSTASRCRRMAQNEDATRLPVWGMSILSLCRWQKKVNG